MPGSHLRVKPTPADSPASASDEGSHLELHLQQQLQEDIASDVYTECNIKQEENKIIAYLNKNLNKTKPICNADLKPKEEIEDHDVFLTPKCVSPYADKPLKSLTSSPSTELNKEYYSIVPIECDCNILDKELREQDLLFNAFHSIIKSQAPDLYKSSKSAKPTTLYLNIDKNKLLKNSISCNNLNYCLSNISQQEDTDKCSVIPKKNLEYKEFDETVNRNTKDFRNIESVSDKVLDSAFTPDSLIADDPSSSSDYLSAANACSPGLSSSGYAFQLNAGDSITKMENIFTSSDSGLENTGLLESITSHKDITADLSLNESTLQDLTTDDASNSHDSMSTGSPPGNIKISCGVIPVPTAIDTAESNFVFQNSRPVHRNKESKSSKEEKQRQNEEIVIMESSSVSSETGSWESVFPPKLDEKDSCEKFLNMEREFINQDITIEPNDNKNMDHFSGPSNPNDFNESFGSSLVHKSPFKNTSCFIDATLLIDDEDTTINIHVNKNSEMGVTVPSQSIPISSDKVDLSPNDWSESNDNDDSLEQTESKEKNLKESSPTVFEMNLVPEDSFGQAHRRTANDKLTENVSHNSFYPLPDTPHNSLRVLTSKSDDCRENSVGSNIPDTLKNEYINTKLMKNSHELSPIVSGGASIKDHLPQVNTASPLARRKLENVPIVSGAYTPNLDRSQSESPKPNNSSAWVIDVSNNKSSVTINQKEAPSKKNTSGIDCSRSRTSVDSDGSEKSSQKFFIDFTNLSSSSPVVKQNTENPSEKKYIFSMFIDLGDKAQVKEMPTLQSSSVNTKRSATNDTKNLNSNYPKGNSDMTETKISISQKINPTDSHDFEKYECLCDDPSMSINEIISLPKKVLVNLPKKTAHAVDKSDITNSSQSADDVKSEHNEGNWMSNEKPTCSQTSFSKDAVASTDCSTAQDVSNNIKEHNLEEPNNWNEASTSGLTYDKSGRYSTASTIREESITDFDSTNEMDSGDVDFCFQNNESDPEPFVKLSDLDKPLTKPYSDKTNKSKAVDMRMTRSIPENNWAGQNHNAAPISLDVISSFHSENALSLNRLFPHLQNEISRSMPGSLSSRTRSPMRAPTVSSAGDGEEQVSDVSELSSMQSSVCRSVVGNSTPEDTGQTSSIINQCQSRLGQDLLRMFLEEIAPDVIVEVSGRRIKAHKCILSSRCQYFAGILSGGWVESAGNVIPLPPFAYNVVHFAMCHIYSGTSSIPESVSIVELATLADMLGLEGLKEAIMFALKSKYCHHFHRPCHVCVAGVLECFPLSSLCGLDDLYHKCLRWITKYFPKVWPTRAFAALPADLLERCFQQHVINMTVENVADTVFGCGLAMMTLQMNIRGVDNVDALVRRLITAAAQFAAPRLEPVLRAMEPLLLDVPTSVLRALDEFVEATIHRAPIEALCRAYAYLESVVREIQIQHHSKPDLISNGYQNETFPGEETYVHARANSWKIRCQYCLLDDALRLVNTQAFRDLPMELQQKLRKLGCVTAPMMQARRCPLRSSRPAAPALNANQADIERMRASFVPYAPRPTSFDVQGPLRNHHDHRDPRNKTNKIPKVKTTKAQEERARFNMAKNAKSQSQMSSTKSIRMFENAKPRYLEPKVAKQPVKKMAAQGKLMPKMMSSSESSRNSSPIQARGARGARARSRPLDGRAHAQAMSQDSLATSSRPRTAEPSTDSLSESQNSNKYATFTKAKHSKGNIESSLQQSSSVSSRSQQSIYNKTRTATKIPVSLTMSKSKAMHNSSNSDTSKRSNSGAGATSASQSSRSKVERKVPGSLMNATKSSSAKVVQKPATKEKSSKSTNKQSKPEQTSTSRQTNDTTSDVPAMGRSGTFLKDEPTFGHNLDIDN
ncbi:uncharacterized protein LOC128682927 isoform X2 [Plodia interpunctella]|uniref:uncharacterized protein LOC128682927 isoform X2 n=1 Tax=Plodia interpunctella TaxID=58824 RepID=UPI002368ECBB|nr:uncharacterized protein LOC128682927 isoform X2 [Plodia interpunctella]